METYNNHNINFNFILKNYKIKSSFKCTCTRSSYIFFVFTHYTLSSHCKIELQALDQTTILDVSYYIFQLKIINCCARPKQNLPHIASGPDWISPYSFVAIFGLDWWFVDNSLSFSFFPVTVEIIIPVVLIIGLLIFHNVS